MSRDLHPLGPLHVTKPHTAHDHQPEANQRRYHLPITRQWRLKTLLQGSKHDGLSSGSLLSSNAMAASRLFGRTKKDPIQCWDASPTNVVHSKHAMELGTLDGGWQADWPTKTYVVFALCSVATSVISGSIASTTSSRVLFVAWLQTSSLPSSMLQHRKKWLLTRRRRLQSRLKPGDHLHWWSTSSLSSRHTFGLSRRQSHRNLLLLHKILHGCSKTLLHSTPSSLPGCSHLRR